MFPIREVTGAQLVFSTSVEGFIPPYEQLPQEFKSYGSKNVCWEIRLFTDWFYRGVKYLVLVPREGVDKEKALRHVRYVMGSWEPKHEHKTAGVAFLLREWFSSGTWESAS